jgi:hypothetical protein
VVDVIEGALDIELEEGRRGAEALRIPYGVGKEAGRELRRPVAPITHLALREEVVLLRRLREPAGHDSLDGFTDGAKERDRAPPLCFLSLPGGLAGFRDNNCTGSLEVRRPVAEVEAGGGDVP